MAKKEKKTWEGLIETTKGGKQIGEYQESTGGGTPMEKGEKIDYVADNPEEAETYKKDNPDAIVRVQQPRNDNGQFTYNSANRRRLKYGPSRGKTVPPFLLGAKLTFAKKSGKGAFVAADGKKYSLPDNIKSEDDFIEAYKDVKTWLSGDAKGKGGKTGKVIEFDEEFMKNKYSEAKKKYGGKKTKYAQPTKDKTEATPAATPTTAESKPVENAPKNVFDTAKSDLGKFKEDNKEKINDFYNFAEQYGYDESSFGDDFWGSVVDEGIESFDELKEVFKDNFA